MRLAALHERAQIGNQQPVRDIGIDVFAHSAHLPGEQPPPSVASRSRRSGIDMPFEQRRCLEHGAVRSRLTLVKLANGRIEQRDNVMHPLAR